MYRRTIIGNLDQNKHGKNGGGGRPGHI